MSATLLGNGSQQMLALIAGELEGQRAFAGPSGQ
jgi:hypothetical protein